MPLFNSSSTAVIRGAFKTKVDPTTSHNLLTISTKTEIRTRNRSFDTISYSLFNDNWMVKENSEAIKGMRFFFNENREKFPGYRIKTYTVKFLYVYSHRIFTVFTPA